MIASARSCRSCRPHIVPVAEGGGECDLEISAHSACCHRGQTEELRHRLRSAKRITTAGLWLTRRFVRRDRISFDDLTRSDNVAVQAVFSRRECGRYCLALERAL